MFGDEIARIRKLGIQGVRIAKARRAPAVGVLLATRDDEQPRRALHFARPPLTPQVLFQVYQFLNVIASGLVMWKALCLVTNSESPIVVVLSYV